MRSRFVPLPTPQVVSCADDWQHGWNRERKASSHEDEAFFVWIDQERIMAIDFASEGKRLLELCIQVQQIPAPTGAEAARAAWVAAYLRHLGYGTVESDALGNVYLQVQGAQRKPALLVSAHTRHSLP